MKILIVEDDLLLGESLHDFLRDLSHEKVQVFHTAGAARRAVQNEQFDCVFVDVRLPDFDGLQLLDTIRSINPVLPVVMMSGYPTMENAFAASARELAIFWPSPLALTTWL